mmetsp:Transcript_37217/g.86817  ORF Transcript_37217/g.86817 Transcript_37217/m.86817 type:complete len:130 (-) Transcript_37217:108-497(-)
MQEMCTVAKMFIEREEEKVRGGLKDIELNVNISSKEKEKMAIHILKTTDAESGVRGIQKCVKRKVSKKLMAKCALEEKSGGIKSGSSVKFSVRSQELSHEKIVLHTNFNSSVTLNEEEKNMENMSEEVI